MELDEDVNKNFVPFLSRLCVKNKFKNDHQVEVKFDVKQAEYISMLLKMAEFPIDVHHD